MNDNSTAGVGEHPAGIVCAVHYQACKRTAQTIIELKARTLCDSLRGLPGTIHVTLRRRHAISLG
ncbi:MAG: hypothetical protein H0W99_04595 [Acidobacteria bacterium]|nr:hypothetical protein [Acidobacteriota bacterium]